MVTSKAEYNKLLASIQNTCNAPIQKILVPADEPIYEVDLDSRTVQAPEFIGVQNDHQAEIIFFIVDRFFGRIDLSNTIGIIQYKNARAEEYIYAIPYYDVITKGKDKLLFPWVIQGPVTRYKGEVEFSIRFFSLNNQYNVIFDLNTRPATSKILSGWQSGLEEYNIKNVTVDEQWAEVIKQMQKYASENPEPFTIYWQEADYTYVPPTDQNPIEEEVIENLEQTE